MLLWTPAMSTSLFPQNSNNNDSTNNAFPKQPCPGMLNLYEMSGCSSCSMVNINPKYSLLPVKGAVDTSGSFGGLGFSKSHLAGCSAWFLEQATGWLCFFVRTLVIKCI